MKMKQRKDGFLIKLHNIFGFSFLFMVFGHVDVHRINDDNGLEQKCALNILVLGDTLY